MIKFLCSFLLFFVAILVFERGSATNSLFLKQQSHSSYQTTIQTEVDGKTNLLLNNFAQNFAEESDDSNEPFSTENDLLGTFIKPIAKFQPSRQRNHQPPDLEEVTPPPEVSNRHTSLIS